MSPLRTVLDKPAGRCAPARSYSPCRPALRPCHTPAGHPHPPAQVTGAWAAIGSSKSRVVCEPRGGGAEALARAMKEYYDAVAAGGGALFIAVCRGKARQGIGYRRDGLFAGGYARAGAPNTPIPDPAALCHSLGLAALTSSIPLLPP
jgi:hypothetical protein